MDQNLRAQISEWIKKALAMNQVVGRAGVNIIKDISPNGDSAVIEANAIGCALIGKLGIKKAFEVVARANVTGGSLPLGVTVARELRIEHPEKFIAFLALAPSLTPLEIADLILEI